MGGWLATQQSHLITRTVGRSKMFDGSFGLFEGAKILLVSLPRIKTIRASEIAMRSNIPVNTLRKSLEAPRGSLLDNGLFLIQMCF